jgi:hypothetical protein
LDRSIGHVIVVLFGWVIGVRSGQFQRRACPLCMFMHSLIDHTPWTACACLIKGIALSAGAWLGFM